MILDSTIQAVKDVPIIDIVGQYVNLRRLGAYYKGLCPFHDERTPSFYVHPAKNIYKCFGCGAGGDALKFVMEYEKKSFIEAVELIAGISNIIIESEEKTQLPKARRERPVKEKIERIPFNTIPATFLSSTKNNISANPLTLQFSNIVGNPIVSSVLDEYHISLNGNWTTFNQIDLDGNYRTGKSVYYKDDAHRADEPMPKWVHRELIKKGFLPEDFQQKQCFTGEHIIRKYPKRPIAIVEGQSTMLFMAVLGKAATKYNIKKLTYFADFIWLSTGGSDGIGWKNYQTLACLKGRDVILFPDAGFYGQWLEDAEIMREDYGINVRVSDFIEKQYQAGLLGRNQDLRDCFMLYAEEIKNICNLHKEPFKISSTNIHSMPVITRTGKDYGYMILAFMKLKDGAMCDILFNKEGEPITEHESIEALAHSFSKSFILGKLDNKDCLINIIKQSNN